MHFDFVDIGTSNFETSIIELNTNPDLKILLVEPVTDYLNQLKKGNNTNIYFCNCAISDTNGEDVVYYLPEKIIDTIFPDKNWLKGCNSIGKHHEACVNELRQKGINLSIVKTQVVKKITFHELCNIYNIFSIGKLTIDTENNEHLILPAVLDKIKKGMLIKSLLVENNRNDENYNIKESIFNDFQKFGYTRIDHFMDVELIKNETNISM